jgi:hypothetical protein
MDSSPYVYQRNINYVLAISNIFYGTTNHKSNEMMEPTTSSTPTKTQTVLPNISLVLVLAITYYITYIE